MSGSDAIARKDTPPDDDVCPVCFSDFDLPCRADCGHWFCGACILKVWKFSSVLSACKCPMCSRFIKSLKPNVSLHQLDEEEAREVIKSLQRYNRLFVGGAQGFLQKLYDAPLFFGRLFREMTNPDQVLSYFHLWRILAIQVVCLIVISPFNFIPESVNIDLLCTFSALFAVVFIKILGVFQRRQAADRVRRMAALQN